jgi:hypothetical protein
MRVTAKGVVLRIGALWVGWLIAVALVVVLMLAVSGLAYAFDWEGDQVAVAMTIGVAVLSLGAIVNLAFAYRRR